MDLTESLLIIYEKFEMSLKYKIYPEKNLLVDVVEGGVNLTDIEKLHGHELSNEDLGCVKNILSIVVNADFHVSYEDVVKYIDILTQKNPDPNLRWSIYTRTPMQTAYSSLLKDGKGLNQIVGVFTTLEGCIDFLGINFDHNRIDDKDYILVD